ncbi:MAG: hypothetical protein K6F68_04930 [Clostridiales bacterium]|nr:hypothetical protein [Clostridiales bacterium]
MKGYGWFGDIWFWLILVECTAMVIIFSLIKRKREPKEYDERQLLSRLKGSRLALLVMASIAVVYMIAAAWHESGLLTEKYERVFSYQAFFMGLLLTVGIGIYTLYAIINDAYSTTNQKPGKAILEEALIGALNLSFGLSELITKKMTLSQLLHSPRILNLFIAVLFLLAIIANIVKSIRSRREME